MLFPSTLLSKKQSFLPENTYLPCEVILELLVPFIHLLSI